MNQDSEETTIWEAKPVLRAYVGDLVFYWLAGVVLGVVVMVLSAATNGSIPLYLGWLIPLVLFAAVLARKLYLVYSQSYRLTSQRLIVRKGLIARSVEEMELFRVKDVSLSQGVIQRLMGFGTVEVLSTDDSTPSTVLSGLHRPEEKKEAIRTATRAARRDEGVRPAEFILS